MHGSFSEVSSKCRIGANIYHPSSLILQAEVECLVQMYTPEAEEQLLGGAPSFVLDAIDNIDTKVGEEGGAVL